MKPLRAAIVGLVVSVVGLALMSSPAFAVEANGTYIKVTGAAPIYEVIGGAAIHVDSCATLDGCPNVVKVASLSGYASVPANGSFIQIQSDGGFVGEIVGGALIHMDSCADLKCPHLPLDPGGAQDYMAAHTLPTSGTLIQAVGPGFASGWTGEVVNSAVIHIDSCTPFSDCGGRVQLDSGGLADYMAAHPAPANGTYIQEADGPQAGLIARVAGGAFLTIGDCDALGGCANLHPLDSGGFNDWSAAHPVPADGTYLLALPSNTTWEVLGGQRQQVPANAAAVAVDDASLNAIPVAQPATSSSPTTTTTTATTPTTQTVTPPTTTTQKPAARKHVKVSFVFKWRWAGASSQLVWLRAKTLKRPYTLSVRCTGKRCPYGLRTWKRGTAAAFLRHLGGGIYHAGDRLTLTIGRRGLLSERITLVIRRGRGPGAKVA